jgi:hypothetical protein
MEITIGALPKAQTVQAIREVAEFIRNITFDPCEITIKIDVKKEVWRDP